MSAETVDFSVFTDMDRVVFRIDKTDFFVPYAQVFKMALQLQLISKRSKAIIHETESWVTLTDADNIEIRDYNTVKPYTKIKGKFDWEFRTDSELIYFRLKDFITSFHFVGGLQLAHMIRIAGKQAKAWAGDTSKMKTAAGILTDAEENYKLGLH